jgi:hypothetical protein
LQQLSIDVVQLDMLKVISQLYQSSIDQLQVLGEQGVVL